MSATPEMPADFANTTPAHWSDGRDPDLNWPLDRRMLTVGDVVAIRSYNALADIVDRDDGWLRIIPSRDGSPIFGKFKFAHGRHAGSYVMVVVQPHDLDELLPQLAGQLLKVDAGILKPTVDKFFGEK